LKGSLFENSRLDIRRYKTESDGGPPEMWPVHWEFRWRDVVAIMESDGIQSFVKCLDQP
jgi:hypothetical protein